MGLRSPPIAQALRRFDPYPEFATALVFKGRPETGGRQFYKSGGLIVPRFEMASGVQIIGGAGFGQREINGAWRGARADEPLIGDGGLRNAEARTNYVRNPTGLGAVPGTPGVSPTNWSITPAGLSSEIVGVGTEKGLPYVDLRLFGTNSTGANAFPDFRFEASTYIAAVVGQTWVSEFSARIVAGSTAGITFMFGFQEANAGGSWLASNAQALSGLSSELKKFRMSAATAQATVAFVAPRITGTVANGASVDLTLRVAAPNLKLGPDINDPPILQESGLPATRTGYSYRETGLNIAPVHYGVARARLVAPLANHATHVPTFLELRPDAISSRFVWFANRNGGNHRIIGAGSNGVSTERPAGAAVAGQYYALAWACRAGSMAYSLDGGAVNSFAVSAITSPFTRVGYLGDAATAGANTANAEMDIFATRNGEISDDALQALSARFAA